MSSLFKVVYGEIEKLMNKKENEKIELKRMMKKRRKFEGRVFECSFEH